MISTPEPAGQHSPFITPLPRPTSTRIRSALIIPTFPRILSELVRNSLDAGATSINIRSSLVKDHESLRVEDDGHGISVDDLPKVGQRFLTSRNYSYGDAEIGARGEALASIASLGMLEIYTKPPGAHDTYAKVIRGENVLFQGPTSRASISRGTTVVVKDVFHNIPVRQAALSSQPSSSILASCRREVETLALAHPRVNWTMWEEPEIGSSASVKRILSLGRSSSSLETFRAMHGRALCERVQKVRVSSGPMKAEGFISLDGAMSRTHQYLYLNGVPLQRGELHAAIAKRFTKSRFSSMCQDEPQRAPPTRSRQSPRLIEKHPIYVLNLLLPAQHARNYPSNETASTGQQDLPRSFLLALFDEFLKRHGFLTRHILAPPGDSSPTRQRGAAQYRGRNDPAASMHEDPEDGDLFEQGGASAPSGKDLLTPRASRHPQRGSYDMTPLGTQARAKKIREILGNSQSRIFSPQKHAHCCHSCSQSDAATGYSTRGPFVPRCNREGQFQLGTASASFHNGAFKTARVLSQVDSKYVCCLLETSAKQTAICLVDQHAADERVSVEILLNELCEGFVSTATPIEPLDPPIGIVLTRSEASALGSDDTLEILRRWGICLAPLSTEKDIADYTQTNVTAVPAVLPRLGHTDSEDLMRLLRTYIPTLDGHIGEIHALLSDIDQGSVVDRGRVLRWMPKEMLDLVNSRACRSAIMFEDKLSLEQCIRLVHQLAETDSPFICAHGRPSVAPLVVLPESEMTGSSRRKIDWSLWGVSQSQGSVVQI